MNNIATLNVILRDTTPPIWRRVAVPADITLVQSHGAIPIAMDWMDTASGWPKPEEKHPQCLEGQTSSESDSLERLIK